jgi:hypothetical protein
MGAEAAMEFDAAIIAKTRGWSHDETVGFLYEQERFVSVVERLIEEYPDDYSSATNLPEPAGCLRSTSRVPLPLGRWSSWSRSSGPQCALQLTLG